MSAAKTGQWLAIAASVVVVATLAAAMWTIGSPSVQREARMDRKREQDLDLIVMNINGHVGEGKPLPANLSELANQPGVSLSISDPESAAPYTYEVTGEDSYKLCAVFSTDSAKQGGNPYGAPEWPHGVGQSCFGRRIDRKKS